MNICIHIKDKETREKKQRANIFENIKSEINLCCKIDLHKYYECYKIQHKIVFW